MRFTVAACALAVFCSVAAAADGPKGKPNVLFIAIDDLRDWVGYLGRNPQTSTPNIDKLASEGARFTRAFRARAQSRHSPPATQKKHSSLTPSAVTYSTISKPRTAVSTTGSKP